MNTDALVMLELDNVAKRAPMNVEDANDYENLMELRARRWVQEERGRYVLSPLGHRALYEEGQGLSQNTLLVELRNVSRLRQMGSHECTSMAALNRCRVLGWVELIKANGNYRLTRSGKMVIEAADPAAARA
jgi:hypothetical protein